MQIIMDKENPLIHKIEELEGKYVPFLNGNMTFLKLWRILPHILIALTWMEEFVSKTRNIHRKESIHWN